MRTRQSAVPPLLFLNRRADFNARLTAFSVLNLTWSIDPNKPNDVNLLIMRAMVGKWEKQTQRPYQPCYQSIAGDFSRFSRILDETPAMPSRPTVRAHRKSIARCRTRSFDGKKGIQDVHSMSEPAVRSTFQLCSRCRGRKSPRWELIETRNEANSY